MVNTACRGTAHAGKGLGEASLAYPHSNPPAPAQDLLVRKQKAMAESLKTLRPMHVLPVRKPKPGGDPPDPVEASTAAMPCPPPAEAPSAPPNLDTEACVQREMASAMGAHGLIVGRTSARGGRGRGRGSAPSRYVPIVPADLRGYQHHMAPWPMPVPGKGYGEASAGMFGMMQHYAYMPVASPERGAGAMYHAVQEGHGLVDHRASFSPASSSPDASHGTRLLQIGQDGGLYCHAAAGVPSVASEELVRRADKAHTPCQRLNYCMHIDGFA